MYNSKVSQERYSGINLYIYLADKLQGLTARHYFALLFIATFGIYYPVIFYGDFIHLDDIPAVNRLLNSPPLVLRELFFPQNIGTYYRPMVELSYRLDYAFWSDSASGYHLTNVMLHFWNVLSVYLVALLLFSRITTEKEMAAFFAALVYAINPLTSESVCWIAGRSDLIAAAFMLPSFAFYLLFKEEKRYAYILFSGLFYLMAATAKEVALVLPALVIAVEVYYYAPFRKKRVPRATYISIGYFFALTALYILFLRNGGVDTTNADVAVGSSGLTSASYFDNIRIFFATIGFYIKKLLFPWPLSFAIHRIHESLYAFVGAGSLLLFVAWNLYRPTVYKFLASWVLITISPAVAAAVLKIPWTLWAERFLYIPLVGISLSLALLPTHVKERHKAWTLALILVLLLLGGSTLQRNFIWADELKLWEDTARKADYGPVYYFHGKALLDRGREAEGREQMEKAIAKGYGYYPYVALASVSLRNKDYAEVENIYRRAFQDYPGRAELHKYLAQSYLSMTRGNESNRKKYYRKAIQEYEKYLRLEKDDIDANFRIAALYKAVGQRERAIPFLQQVVKSAPDSKRASAAARILNEMRK